MNVSSIRDTDVLIVGGGRRAWLALWLTRLGVRVRIKNPGWHRRLRHGHRQTVGGTGSLVNGWEAVDNLLETRRFNCSGDQVFKNLVVFHNSADLLWTAKTPAVI